jgi:hypothetical protein
MNRFFRHLRLRFRRSPEPFIDDINEVLAAPPIIRDGQRYAAVSDDLCLLRDQVNTLAREIAGGALDDLPPDELAQLQSAILAAKRSAQALLELSAGEASP